MIENIEKEYVRVSDVISSSNSSEYSGINLEVLANAALRGEKVHAYCVAYAKGMWLPELEEECQPYFDSFKQWYDQYVDHLCLAETRLYCNQKKITGRFDLIVVLKQRNQIALVDLKSSANPSKSWPIQLAAYEYLLKVNNYDIDIAMNLHLKKNGKGGTSIVPHDLSESWEIFQSCLNVYNYFHRKEAK